MRRSVCCTCMYALTLLAPNTILGSRVLGDQSSEGSVAVDTKRFEFQRAGFVAGREKIRTCVFTGRIESAVETSDGIRNRFDLFRCWRDYERDLIRFERTNPLEFDGSDSQDFRKWRGIIQNSDGCLLWDNHRLEIHPKERRAAQFSSVGLFDVRTVGLFGYQEFNGASVLVSDFVHASNRFLAFEESAIIDEASVPEGTLLRITGSNGKVADFHVEYLIQGAPEFVPLHRRIFAPNGTEPSVNYLEDTIEWGSVNEIVIPLQIDMIARELSAKRFSRAIAVSIQWESVNSPIPAEIFSRDGWTLPTGTNVYSRADEHPILEEVVGLSDRDALLESSLGSSTPEAKQVEPIKSNRLYKTVAVNLAIVAILGYLRFRRIRKQSRKTLV